MKKKDIFLLFVPSAIFLVVALGLIDMSRRLYPDEQGVNKGILNLTKDAERGDFGPHAHKLIMLVKDSRLNELALEEVVVRSQRCAAGCLLGGIVLQAYVILRIRAKYATKV